MDARTARSCCIVCLTAFVDGPFTLSPAYTVRAYVKQSRKKWQGFQETGGNFENPVSQPMQFLISELALMLFVHLTGWGWSSEESYFFFKILRDCCIRGLDFLIKDLSAYSWTVPPPSVSPLQLILRESARAHVILTPGVYVR